jgi:3-oxoadipate CoA-transferase beta subunit
MSGLDKRQMAREVARDLPDGSYVNLGIGLPIMVAAELAEERDIVVHSENGILGMGAPAAPGAEDWNLVDAAKGAVTLRTGGSFVSHADSFAIIRGGHIDVSVMGAFQVSGTGDLANWWNGEGIPGVGGAMDLAVGARRVFAVMRHTTPDGGFKIVPECTYPLTARGVVSRIYTEYGIFEPTPTGEVIAHGLAADVTLAFVQSVTAVPVVPADDLWSLPRG